MGLYQNNNGTLVPIAGRGKAEYGASTMRTGSAVGSATALSDSYRITVTFSEPMPDTNYEIELSPNDSYQTTPRIETKTVNGFTALAAVTSGSVPRDITWTYTAFKLYTDTEYNNIIDAVPSDASASNKLALQSQLVKSIEINNSAINANGYLAHTIPIATKVISVVCKDASNNARLVVADSGTSYAIQIFKGTGNTVVTSGSASVVYYYID